MKILILGIDGYIGWPLALHLLDKGHEVCGVDNRSRRARVEMCGSDSLTPILTFSGRERVLRSYSNYSDLIAMISTTDKHNLNRFLSHHKPDVIVHLAEQPSAPWSMRNANESINTQYGNVIGTLNLLWGMKENCPEAHLVKLGTMGEYGTPDCDIPEGEIPEVCISGCVGTINENLDLREFRCPMSGLPFPKSPGSFYHLSKVHDTNNIIFACKTWGLRSTDIMQGVVFGLNTHKDGGSVEPELLTRFDYDQYFGTVINRFCAQVIIDHPLTVYGEGNQARGFLPLKDSIQCLTITIENPPQLGEYRTFNQFESVYTINSLAHEVCVATLSLGMPCEIKGIDNPRSELGRHYYNPTHQRLFDLGYEPTTDIQGEITQLLETIFPYHERVNKEVIMPTTKWR